MGNRPHYYASCYYEALLRYWSATQTAYILSTQVNVVSHAVALEINKATHEAGAAYKDALNTWVDFINSLDESIIIDDDMLGDCWNDSHYAITIVFSDGLTITAASALYNVLKFGGLPAGTFVYINSKSFEIAENGFYMISPNIHGFDRLTTVINYGG